MPKDSAKSEGSDEFRRDARGRRATLALTRPIKVGMNGLTLTISYLTG
jgi:hypothetical protein